MMRTGIVCALGLAMALGCAREDRPAAPKQADEPELSLGEYRRVTLRYALEGAGEAELAEAMAVIEARLSSYGVAAVVAPAGEGEITVEVAALLPARLGELDAVVRERGGALAIEWLGDRVAAEDLARTREGRPGEAAIALEVVRADVEETPYGPMARVGLDAASAEAFYAFTKAHTGEQAALWVGDRLNGAPIIAEPIPGGELTLAVGPPGEEGAGERAVALAVALATGGALGAELRKLSEEVGELAACEGACASACEAGDVAGCARAPAAARACELGHFGGCERICERDPASGCAQAAAHTGAGLLVARDRRAAFTWARRGCAAGAAAGCLQVIEAELAELALTADEPASARGIAALRGLVDEGCAAAGETRCEARAALAAALEGACAESVDDAYRAGLSPEHAAASCEARAAMSEAGGAEAAALRERAARLRETANLRLERLEPVRSCEPGAEC
jgi:hypothetical protein